MHFSLGFAAGTIREAFLDVQMQAAATQATKPFFHAYVRLPKGEAAEKLTRELWLTFAERLEKQLGFTDQPRAIAFHHGASGESHMHIAWSRIDLETLTAIDPGLYKNKMKNLCRAFEQEFGLTRVANERGADVKTKSAARPEFEQSRRLGSDLKAVRNAIHDCWQSADSGQAFAAALAEHDLMLARGDRRAFVVIDREGGDHALSKRITGATAAATRQRMADLDSASLPSVADAKAMQQAQRTARMSEIEAPEIDQEAATHAAQRDRLVREAAQLAEAERVQAQMPSARNYREQMERDAEEAKKNEKERQQKDADRAAAGDIADAHNRYAQALGSTYSVRDPYGSLANAAMVEYASFHRQQDGLRKEAAAEQDPDKRRLIELRREIEGHDYMAITSERLAGIGRAITMSDNAGARADDALAKTHVEMGSEKRQERAELQRELKERQKDERAATERGGRGLAAQQGAATEQRERSRRRSPAEEAMQRAAGRRDAPTKDNDEAARSAQQQQEQAKQREGLRPDQPTETAPPTKEARQSAAEKALRDAAGPSARNSAGASRDADRPQGRPRGGGGRGR